MTRRIYLDHNATAPPAPVIPELLATLWSGNWGNPSSAHAEGRRARALFEESRERVAHAIGASRGEVVFCSGGSEADSLAEALRGVRRALVSVMLAQNEIGTLNDIPAIAEVAHRAGALLHVDAVQAFGKIALSFDALGADLLSISAHKIGGPPGVGALVLRPGLDPAPFCAGGGQEGRRRPGTEAFPLVVAFGAAAEGVAARVAARRDRFEREIRARVPGALIAGAAAPRLPNTAAVLFAGRFGRSIAATCDARGVAVSAGSACHAGEESPSPVVRALGVGAPWRHGLVRVSLGPQTEEAEVDRALEVLVEALREAA